MSKIFCIGLDPGKVTGFSVYDKHQKKLVTVTSYGKNSGKDSLGGDSENGDPHPGFGLVLAQQEIEKWCSTYGPQHGYSVRIYVEAVHQNLPVFPSTLRGVNQENARLKVAQDIGGNKREAQIFLAWAKIKGLDIRAIKPTKKSGTKMDAKRFKQITSWQGQTNEHARDAAMLVYGL